MSKKVTVFNRNNGSVGYVIPEMNNLQRQFAPGETKQIDLEELQQLYWIPGGRVILENYLVIQDEDAVQQLQMKVEPEYFYTDDDVKKIMLRGSLDQFLDMLDFAPLGVIESIKELAVSLPLNDVEKRDAIFEKTGFNVTKAIENLKSEDEEAEKKTSGGRRSAKPESTPNKEEEKTPSRRYIVSK